MTVREEQLRRDAAAMADAVDRELERVFQPVSAHADRVSEMAQELTLLADRTVRHAEALRIADDGGDRIAMAERVAMAEILRSLSGGLHAMTQRSVQDVHEVKTRLVRTVRATALGNRRRYERFEVDVPAEAGFLGRRESARIVNLSLGGAKMDLAVNREVGTLVSLKIDGISRELEGEVVKVSEDGTQIRFIIGDEAADELRRFLDRTGSTGPRQSD